MYTPIEEYILRPLEERQAHLDLTLPCIEIGARRTGSDFRGMLAHYVKTTLPRGHKIHMCHACFNWKCSNAKHLYWGSQKENGADTIRAGRNKAGIKALKAKYTPEELHKMAVEAGRKGGLSNKGRGRLSPEELKRYFSVFRTTDMTRRGSRRAVARQLDVSPTHVGRMYRRWLKENRMRA